MIQYQCILINLINPKGKPVKKKSSATPCCTTAGFECCKVEGIVSVDDRGQMVLSKELRAKAGIKPGDKLAVTTWEDAGQVKFITLIKTNDFASMVRSILGPMANELAGTGKKK